MLIKPLEQTRAGQELMDLGEIKGLEKGRGEGLHDAIRIVLLTRFPQVARQNVTRLMALLSYIHDVATVEILLQLAMQIDSLAAFEQKVLVAAAKSALHPPVNGKASTKEETE